MKTFKIRTLSGGIIRQTFFLKAADLAEVCREVNATLVEEQPGWAFVHYSSTTSAEITW